MSNADSENCAEAALLELNTDMGSVRTAIRMYNDNRDAPGYWPLLSRIRSDYPSYFGPGSTNGNNVMASLRNLEGYLAEEIEAVATNVTERINTERLCGDRCWEGLVILGREEQERRSWGKESED